MKYNISLILPLRFYEPAQQVFDNAPADASQDFNVQMCKMGVGLLSGNYSKAPPPAPQPEDKQPRIVVSIGIYVNCKDRLTKCYPYCLKGYQNPTLNFKYGETHVVKTLET